MVTRRPSPPDGAIATVESAVMPAQPADDKQRWERNERVRRRVLERDRQRPAPELLAQTIELSRVAMKLRAGAKGTRGK